MTTTDDILRQIGAALGQPNAPMPYRAPAISDLVTRIDGAIAARSRRPLRAETADVSRS